MNAGKLPNEFNEIKEYSLFESFENKTFTIKISKTKSNIFIIANEVFSPNITYQIELSFNDFQRLSKGFKMCDTLEEIFEVLNNIFSSKKASIIKKINCLIIIIKIMLIEGSEQKINIELGKIINKETNVNDNN